MRIDYELTQRDFVESFSAHRNRNRIRKWLRWLSRSVLLLFAVFIALGFIIKPNAQDAKNLAPFFGLICLWMGILWVTPRWNARKQFLKQPGAQGPRSVLLDASGVHWRWNGGSSDIAWKNYVQALEGKNQFLLYTSPACFSIIPKRALTQEGLLEFQGLLKQNIPEKMS